MVSTALIVSIVVALIAVALGAAYTTGALDPIIEQIGMILFKAEAKAEEKKLEAQGMKEGEDFLSSQLKGNKQAGELADGVGSGGLDSLKKAF